MLNFWIAILDVELPDFVSVDSRSRPNRRCRSNTKCVCHRCWARRSQIPFVRTDGLIAGGNHLLPHWLAVGRAAHQHQIVAFGGGQENSVFPYNRRRTCLTRQRQPPGDVFGFAEFRGDARFLAYAIIRRPPPLRPVFGTDGTGCHKAQRNDRQGRHSRICRSHHLFDHLRFGVWDHGKTNPSVPITTWPVKRKRANSAETIDSTVNLRCGERKINRQAGMVTTGHRPLTTDH